MGASASLKIHAAARWLLLNLVAALATWALGLAGPWLVGVQAGMYLASWPSLAAALVALYYGGPALLPGVFFGLLAMVGHYWGCGPVEVFAKALHAPLPRVVLGMALLKILETGLAALGIRALLRERHPLQGLWEISVFGAVVTASALVGEWSTALLLQATGNLAGATLLQTAMLRWAGATASMICLGGFFLAFAPRYRASWAQRSPWGLAANALALAGLFAGSYLGWMPNPAVGDLAVFLSMPINIFASYRYGPLVGLWGVVLALFCGTYGVPLGNGPLAEHGTPQDALLSLQMGLAAWGLTNLWVSGLAFDRQHMEDALKGSLQSFDRLINSTFEGILVHQAGKIVMINEAFLSVCGYTREEVLGRDPFFCVAPESREVVMRHWKTKTPHAYEITVMARNGERIPVEVAAQDILFKGKPARVVTAWDLSRRKRNEQTLKFQEEQLRHSQKMEAVGRLAGGIAHDFNNLLVGIQGYAELLEQRVQDTPRLQKPAQAILRCAGRAGELTQHLLNFSRKGTQSLVYLDFHPLVQGVVNLLDHCLDKRVDLRVALGAQQVTLHGDAALLESMVLNLCLNAGDAMPGGGELWLRTANIHLEAGGEKHPTLPPGDYLHFFVQDNGFGMSEEVRAKCFDPFFTTKEVGEGTGLGLATVYGVVKSHGGDIQVHSETGKGTTFEILLPLAKVQSGLTSEAISAPGLPRGNGRVLVVDDEPHVRELCQELLGGLGYEVTLCPDGLGAVELFVQAQGDFPLVVLDMVMPRLDGHETLNLLREVNPDVKVVICSGFSQKLSEINTASLTNVVVLQKPFRLEALANAVNDLLQGQNGNGAG